MTWEVRVGDALERLREMPAESVQCVVTSPPYFGLRDYGTAMWEGGDPTCEHYAVETVRTHWANSVPGPAGATAKNAKGRNETKERGGVCGRCGAASIDQQIGLEPTPEEYVSTMVEVFREVRRVLAKDGTVWLNLGDSYAGSWGNQGREEERGTQRPINGGMLTPVLDGRYPAKESNTGQTPPGLKPKDLIGIPWRLAFALQADGWVLRSEIVWSKPNPMPESVTDRPTKAHEQVFLLSKAEWRGGVQPLPMREADAAWLAALVDGEGSICFQEKARASMEPHVGIRLSLVNTNRALLERITDLTSIDGGPGSPSPRYRGDGTSGRSVFAWQVTDAKAARIIAAIRPYLIAKTRQADLALAAHEMVQKHRGRRVPRTTPAETEAKRRLAAACSALNHGEEPDLSWFRPPPRGRWVPLPYMYDADAVREPQTGHAPGGLGVHEGNKFDRSGGNTNGLGRSSLHSAGPEAGRNLRSVWNIATEPFPDAHFATFPKALVEPCIKAGTSEKGCCPECGKGWVRVVERTAPTYHEERRGKSFAGRKVEGIANYTSVSHGRPENSGVGYREVRTTGWRPSCSHDTEPIPAVVLDPFCGSGTTGLVALRLGRSFIGIELSPTYAEMARNRITDDAPLFNTPDSQTERV